MARRQHPLHDGRMTHDGLLGIFVRRCSSYLVRMYLVQQHVVVGVTGHWSRSNFVFTAVGTPLSFLLLRSGGRVCKFAICFSSAPYFRIYCCTKTTTVSDTGCPSPVAIVLMLSSKSTSILDCSSTLPLLSTLSPRNALSGFPYHMMACFLGVRKINYWRVCWSGQSVDYY